MTLGSISTAARAVSCRGLTKSFGSGNVQARALQGATLDVSAGELLMLVGPSGCGKTTLISIIAGVLDADGGECQVLGHDLMHLTPGQKTAFRSQSIGFVFQSYNLIPPLSASDNVALPLLIRGVPARDANARANDMLAKVGLADRVASLPGDLSGGQQQRVAIARALVHRPALVVCDEPTSALDHRTGHALMELLSDVALAEGRSLIVVTHDARIFGFAHRMAEMDDGRVVHVGRPNAEQLQAAALTPHAALKEAAP
jgi:putative ABC transport system ATP-binding protein